MAVGTASGLEQDLIGAGGVLPRLLLRIFGWAGGIGLLVVLVVQGVDLVLRSRTRQLLESVAAAGAGALLALLLQRLVLDGHLGAVLAALTKANPGGGRTAPVDGLLVASVAFFTVSGVGGRQILRRAAVVVVASAILSGFLSGGVTALALFATALLGWSVGLVTRLALGPRRPAHRAPQSQLPSSVAGWISPGWSWSSRRPLEDDGMPGRGRVGPWTFVSWTARPSAPQ